MKLDLVNWIAVSRTLACSHLSQYGGESKHGFTVFTRSLARSSNELWLNFVCFKNTFTMPARPIVSENVQDKDLGHYYISFGFNLDFSVSVTLRKEEI